MLPPSGLRGRNRLFPRRKIRILDSARIVYQSVKCVPESNVDHARSPWGRFFIISYSFLHAHGSYELLLPMYPLLVGNLIASMHVRCAPSQTLRTLRKVDKANHKSRLKESRAPPPLWCRRKFIHGRDSRPLEGTRTTLAAVHARDQTLEHRHTLHGHLVRQLSAACCTLSSLRRDLRLACADQRVVEHLSRKLARVTDATREE